MLSLNDVVKAAHSKISNDITYLDPVTDDMCIPIRSENGLTAWKFTFSDKVVWIPSGSIKGITLYASIFRVLSSILVDYGATYEVYDDLFGMTAVALGISDDILFSTQNDCIEQNLDSVKFGTPQVKSEKTKTFGIFFGGGLSTIIDDRNYERVYNLIRADLSMVGMYMYCSMMSYSQKSTNYIADNVTFCGEFALVRYKRMEGHAVRGPKEEIEQAEVEPKEENNNVTTVS